MYFIDFIIFHVSRRTKLPSRHHCENASCSTVSQIIQVASCLAQNLENWSSLKFTYQRRDWRGLPCPVSRRMDMQKHSGCRLLECGQSTKNRKGFRTLLRTCSCSPRLLLGALGCFLSGPIGGISRCLMCRWSWGWWLLINSVGDNLKCVKIPQGMSF